MDTKRVNLKLDGETHHKLKVKAAEDKSSLQEIIVHLIKQWLYGKH